MKVKKMQRTKIEWADFSYNPVVGCSKVSDGCLNCYAEAMVHRFPDMTGMTHGPDPDPIGWDRNAHFFPYRLEEPFHLRPGKDRPHRIFVCSMSDLFHESLSNEQIAAVFGVMAATPHHQYVVLTKRLQHALEWCAWADRHFDGLNTVRKLFPEIAYQEILRLWLTLNLSVKYTGSIPNNVIIGASVENQKAADERIPLLLQIPARWRGVSVEPMLEGIELGLDWIESDPDGKPHFLHDIDCKGFCEYSCGGIDVEGGIDLVICGAETGPKKRPFKDEWAMDLLDQCKAAGTPFFFKKDGNGNPTLRGVEYHEWIGE